MCVKIRTLILIYIAFAISWRNHIMYSRSDFKSGQKFDLDTVIGADQIGVWAEML